ncbi:MAG: hypothetical protein Q9213_001390 [Squamulea squamosa]
MRILDVVVITLSVLRTTSAVPWVEPSPTPQARLFDAGVSPRPTEAPGLNGIPRELFRRQQDVIYPPPPNWCGFVSGNYYDPLTCNSPYTCIASQYGFGCCTGTLPCSNIYTTCKDYGAVCDAVCEGNEKVRKCSDSALPYCGTYRFSGGTRLYNCDSTTGSASSVEFLSDYYITAISSTLPPWGSRFTSTEEPASASSTLGSYLSSHTPYPSSSYSGGGLSVSAIRNIAIGASVGACVIFILLAIFIVKRRRANRMKRAAQPSLPPAYSPSAPMQQQPLPSNNPAYQPVPQHDQSFPPAQGGYFAPNAAGKNNGTTVTTQASLSPPAAPTPQQRHSLAPSSFLSANPSDQGRDSFYKPSGPISPTITEVDGSGRPMPEADSIERPTSSHQGMVSPMATGSSPGSPPPQKNTPQYGQQFSNMQPQQGQGQGQGQMHSGYVPPRAGTYEIPPSQAYAGPYEMPDQRH